MTSNARAVVRLDGSGHRLTVGVWAGDYETWRVRNLAEIEKIAEWAESKNV